MKSVHSNRGEGEKVIVWSVDHIGDVLGWLGKTAVSALR